MMKTAKLGAIFVISFMALAGTGSAYALWFDYLHLDVDVETGWIGAEWSIERAWDSEPADKDFSKITAELRAWPEGTDGVENRWLFIHITGAYPCIDYFVNIDIHNTGTLPIHIAAPEEHTYDNQLIGENGIGTIKFYNFVTGARIIWGTTIVQIHPGEHFWITAKIHFNNNLPQGGPDIPPIWVYCMNFPYHQWNEPYPEIIP